ncbi:helix-turn-helix transcriptional regulator [Amycolatopsis palatopharyngis]|uniref:helix-turn-helix transcriptional regulator n=1 Tax=Amycolatopsis palatopharyngis TaxID=187982 RepID=UPI000E23157E|nr:AraC family transcriptional regulator [Amycolatopsis palatopharyngis]
MQTVVEKAILSMRERYYDPLTLQEIAAEVFVSPFHFSRIFTRDTGVTPGRYLTSIRLFEAKRLLLTTSLTVSDIVCSVGYSSVGTFTTRFTQAVGLTPTQYRDPEVNDLLVAVATDFHRVPSIMDLDRLRVANGGVRAAMGGSISGTLHLPDNADLAPVFVGVFGNSIPQRGPVTFTSAPSGGTAEVTMNNIPAGDWTVIATAQGASPDAEPGEIYAGRSRRPVPVVAGRVTRVAVQLRKVTRLDPPIAITLATGETLSGMRARAARQRTVRAAA